MANRLNNLLDVLFNEDTGKKDAEKKKRKGKKKKKEKKERKEKKKNLKNRLDELASINFEKQAKKYAERSLQSMPQEMGKDLEYRQPEITPLAFSIAEEIVRRFDVYAVNEIGRLFVHEPGNGHFTEMDAQKFSLFLSKAYADNADVQSLLSESVRRDVFGRLVSTPAIQVPQELFEAQERFINVANGVVDLATGELKKHDAKRYGFLGVLPFSYVPKYATGDKMPRRFGELLKRTFPGQKNRKRFLQCLAYLISNDCSKKVAFFWVGKPHTGKSTFQRFIAKIVGKENISNIPLDKFSDRFSVASLFGKKLNMAGRREPCG